MLRIAIIGPESTGKTVLAQGLSKHFDAPWIPEYARSYVEKLQRPYNFDDVCTIARKQIELETTSEQGGCEFVFFDTDLIITKVWFEYCYKTCPDFVVDRLNKGFFDLYLLCMPDLDWLPDPVREHGDDRDFFFEWYKKEIERIHKPYILVSGQGNSRIEAVVSILSDKNKMCEILK
jgi:NadR type nicotinamide-nucleotide adenylyltransferase